jgi:hypothetical protein
MPTLICDCNKTMPLDAQALGRALDEDLTLHSTLCRREAGAFQQAVKSGAGRGGGVHAGKAPVRRTGAANRGAVSPVRFVNIRETGGWSRDAKSAAPSWPHCSPAAKLPEPEPVPTVTYKSEGRLLVIGPLEQAERFAALLATRWT